MPRCVRWRNMINKTVLEAAAVRTLLSGQGHMIAGSLCMMQESFSIAGREVSPSSPPYIIAEMSGNHNHDIGRAKALIEAAAWAGADAVKLQTYTADTITIRSERPEFTINEGLWKGRALHELYQEAYTPWEWHADLFAHAKACGITIFSSAFKIASAEIIDWGLLEKVASTGKPVIVSTGMASEEEVGDAIHVLRENGCHDIAIFHCISAYPTPLEQANLRRIKALRERFDVNVGLSDHTMGLTAGIAAAAVGAPIFEKHFTLKRADGGVDSAFSLEKEELKDYCTAVRGAWAALGTGDLGEAEADKATRKFRRSLYFVAPVAKGEIVSATQVRSIRPGNGLLPRYLKELIGRKAVQDIAAGTPASWSLVE
jgi:N-acetylneuraminate synthase